jgi:hypothetical protein
MTIIGTLQAKVAELRAQIAERDREIAGLRLDLSIRDPAYVSTWTHPRPEPAQDGGEAVPTPADSPTLGSPSAARPEGPYPGVTCRGCWALGTACGHCAKCIATKPPTKRRARPWAAPSADGGETWLGIDGGRD